MKSQHPSRSVDRRLRRRDRGASLVEYALLVVLIAIACLVMIRTLGSETSEKYSDVGRSVALAGP